MRLERALSIEGWMGAKVELPWLAEQASKHIVIAEVGCHLGRSTAALAENTRGEVYAVDSWADDEIYRQFRKNTDGLPVVAIRTDSAVGAGFLNHIRFDMIFIDADHYYESVKADIVTWRPLLKKGGLFCGHDFQPQFPGVIQAVKELIPDYQLVPGNSSIWYVQ